MPELPDVEAVIGKIKNKVLRQRIAKVTILDPIIVVFPKGRKFAELLAGRRITAIDRRGKYILFMFNNDHTLVAHMRMTGDFQVGKGKKLHRHTRAVIAFRSKKELRFIDQRRLGKMCIVPDKDFRRIKGLYTMGPEPLDKDFTLQKFISLLEGRNGRIKALLLDQGFIAGIGNVYGDEILFQAGIRPERRADRFKDLEVERLYRKIRSVLSIACKHDADLSGLKGWFISGRDRGFCPRCKGSLDRVKIQGRYSYFCPKCQK